MKSSRKVIGLCLVTATLFSCAGPKKALKYEVAESLVEILSEFQREINYDSYKFSAPKDLEGRNIFKTTLTRLNNYERIYPGRFKEIIAYNRARSWERLKDYQEAIKCYREVMPYPPLRKSARENMQICQEFDHLKRQYEKVRGKDQEKILLQFNEMIDSWALLIRKYEGTPYESLAREEQEQLEFTKVLFLEKYWFHRIDGKLLIHKSYRSLIKKHLESKNINRYFIKCGDFYTRSAQEYAEEYDPGSNHFKIKEFERLAHIALELYEIPAAKDGIPEKLEAKGKLEALNAYINYMRDLNR